MSFLSSPAGYFHTGFSFLMLGERQPRDISVGGKPGKTQRKSHPSKSSGRSRGRDNVGGKINYGYLIVSGTSGLVRTSFRIAEGIGPSLGNGLGGSCAIPLILSRADCQGSLGLPVAHSAL
jgi:hypothetical protein